MSGMSHKCYANESIKPQLTDSRMLINHLTTGHTCQLLGIINCKITMGRTLMTHSFIVCKHLTKDLVIELHMQRIYRIGCDWIAEDKLYLHLGCHVPVNSLSVNMNKPKL